MITESLTVDAATFASTGWTAEPHGLCRGDVCVPAPGALDESGATPMVDVPLAATALGAPLIHDPAHGLWAMGPATTSGHALMTATSPDPTLIDRNGNPFRLSNMHGKKVLLVAWASW